MQLWAAQNQLEGFAVWYIRALVTVNQSPVRHKLVQRRSDAQDLSRSWTKVLAVTVPLAWGRVDIIQLTIQATIVDLPMPWPELTAIRTGETGASPVNPWVRVCSPRRWRKSRCQPSGPS